MAWQEMVHAIVVRRWLWVFCEAGIGTMNEMSLHSALKDLYVESLETGGE